MLRTMSFRAVAVSFLLASPLFAEQINSTWVGGLSAGEWENASNWNPAIVPGNGPDTFVVTINGKSVIVWSNHSIDSLDTYGTVKLKAEEADQPDITLTDSLTNHGYLKMYGPEIFGEVINNSGATISVTIPYEFNVFGPGGVQNFGTILLGHQIWAEYDINNVGTIEMYNAICDAAGNIINDTMGIIKGSGLVGFETFQIDNKGLIQGGGGTLSLFASSISNTGTMKNNPGATIVTKAGLNNQGNIEINADGAITFDSDFINEPDGIVRMLGGTLAATTITQSADANFSGFGGITGNIVIEPNGLIELTGPTNIVGDVNIPAGATLEISDGQTLITGHTTCDGTIHLKGGTVIFQGGCDCADCNIIHEAGEDRILFDVNADGIENLKDFAVFAENWLWQATWY